MAKETGKKKQKKQNKDKKQKQAAKPAERSVKSGADGGRSEAPADKKKHADKKKKSKVSKAVAQAKTAASGVAENPLITEVVAAALVATAAAIKDPKKARRLAAESGTELKAAGDKSSAKSEMIWNIALAIAQRSLDALGPQEKKDSDSSEPKKT